MDKPLNTPSYAFSIKDRHKDKQFHTQLKQVFTAFYKQPKTMLMVAVETGILRANICRYVARLEDRGAIQLVNKGICPISKHRAGYYTTNPELFTAIPEPQKTESYE